MNRKANGTASKKQSAKKPPRKARRAPGQEKARYPRLVEFPQARGRTVERVELNLDSDFHCISIRFQDETDLTFVIDPALNVPGRLFQMESRGTEGAQAVAGGEQRWHVSGFLGLLRAPLRCARACGARKSSSSRFFSPEGPLFHRA